MNQKSKKNYKECKFKEKNKAFKMIGSNKKN